MLTILRWITDHVRGFWGAVVTVLSLGFILALAMVVAFGVLADEVMEGATQAFDVAVLRWIGGVHSPTLDNVMLEITGLGNFAVVLVFVLTVSAFLWVTRHRYSVALLMLGGAGGIAVNTVLKLGFDRARPSVFTPVTHVATSSFPSGHAMMTTIVFGSVAVLVGRLEPTRVMRVMTWIGCVLIILLVGLSRIYLGVHYPSDILGGYIAGIAWVAFVAAGMHAMRYISKRHPGKAEKHEKDLDAEERHGTA